MTTPVSDRDRERSSRDSGHSAKSTAMEIHAGVGGGNVETPLGADASWSDEMERSGEDKFNTEAPMMNNQRNPNNRNPRLVYDSDYTHFIL